MVLGWQIKDDSPNLPNFPTIWYMHVYMHNIICMYLENTWNYFTSMTNPQLFKSVLTSK